MQAAAASDQNTPITTELNSQNTKRRKIEVAAACAKPSASVDSKGSDEIHLDDKNPKTVTSETAGEKASAAMKTAREYQLHCFEMAKQRNTFIYLGTGLGKTLIAELLIQWFLKKDEEDDRFIIFLAPGTYLLEQQAAIIERETDARVKVLHGELNNYFSLWNAEDFHERVNRSEFDVIAIGPDLFVRALQCGFLRMETDIRLLIFDEAHHCHGRDKYRLIMDLFYFRCPVEARPKVLCLSASPIKDAELKKENIKERFQKVQCQFDSRIVPPPRHMLQMYMHRVRSTVKVFEDAEDVTLQHVNELQGVEKGELFHTLGSCYPPALQTVLKIRFKTLRAGAHEHVNKVLESPYWRGLQLKLRELICELGVRAAVVFLKREMSELTQTDFFLCKCPFCREIRRADAGARVAEPSNCLMVQTLIAMGKILGNHLRSAAKSDQSPMQPVSGKMKCLCEVLVRELGKVGRSLKGVIFCKRRLVALELSGLLKARGLRADYVVGVKGRDAAHMTRQVFNQAMGRFHDSGKNDDINFLVATSVVEEGVDVPACRLIVMFDEVETVKQQIQCNGRARHAEAQVVHLVMNVDRQRVLLKLEKMAEVREEMDQFVKSFYHHAEGNAGVSLDSSRLVSVEDFGSDCLYVAKTGALITTHTSKAFLHNIFYHFDPTIKEDKRVPLSEPHLSTKGLTKPETIVPDFGGEGGGDASENGDSAALVDPKRCRERSFVCRLKLPPLNDIMNYTGECMDAISVEGKGKSRRIAEYRACLNALTALHERKILDDHLTVVGRGCPSNNDLHHAPMNRGRAMPVYRITRRLPPYFAQGQGRKRKVYPSSQQQSPRLWLYGFVPCGETDSETQKLGKRKKGRRKNMGPVGLLLPHRIPKEELARLCTDFYPPRIEPGVPSWPRPPNARSGATLGGESALEKTHPIGSENKNVCEDNQMSETDVATRENKQRPKSAPLAGAQQRPGSAGPENGVYPSHPGGEGAVDPSHPGGEGGPDLSHHPGGEGGPDDPFHHPVRLQLLSEKAITLSPDKYAQVLMYQKHLFRVSRLIRGEVVC